MPELNDSEPVGLYRLGDLRRFYACTYALCACIARLEDMEDRKFEGEHLMGSWVYAQPLENLVDWLSRSSRIPHDSVRAIITDLSLDASRSHCTLIATPFIPTHCGQTMFAPRLFSDAHPQRMILSALTTGSGRRSYDRVSIKIEKWWLSRIFSQLQTHRSCAFKEPKLKFHTGLKTPDFLILDPRRRTAHVVEFKNYAPATDVRAVCSRVKEFESGLVQLQNYVHEVTSARAIVKASIGISITGFTVSGVILLRHPMPLPIQPPQGIEIVDWQTVQENLERFGMDFADAVAKSRTAYLDNHEFASQDFQVGQWKYRRVLKVRS